MTLVQTLPLALPEALSGAAAQLMLPRRRRGAPPLAAVVICPGFADGPDDRGSPAAWIGRGLADRGIAVTLPTANVADGPADVDERLRAIAATIGQLRRTTAIDPARIGVLGIDVGAALACCAGSSPEVARLAFVGPVAPELVVRRLDRVAERIAERGRDHSTGGATGRGPDGSRRAAAPAPNESAEASLMRRLAALEPLRTLADAPARPALILHAASDEREGPEHARAIAMALSLDGRPIDRVAVGFVDASFAAVDDEPLRQAVLAPLEAFFLTRSMAP